VPILLLLDASGGPPRILPVPAPAASPTHILGCGIARADIFTRGGATRALDLPNITSVQWGRMRSDTSEATVEMDGLAVSRDPACCAIMRTIRPWKHELHIYRDDVGQWSGPITEMTLDGYKLIIKARDLSAWLDRRFIHTTKQYGGTKANQGSTDSQVIFLAASADGWLSDKSPLNGAAELFTDTNSSFGAWDLNQRTYTPAQFKTVAPELRDLAKGNLDWTVINREGKVNGSSIWQNVVPNPVVNPSFITDASGWAGMTRDTGVLHGASPSGRTAAPPNATGSMVGLTVGQKYLMRVFVRGTSSALDAAQIFNDDGVVKVGNDESSTFSWYVYGQPTGAAHNDPGRIAWARIGVYFTATATTMPITITATGNPIDSHGIYFTLHDYSLAIPPKVTLSGLNQTNRTVLTNKQAGTDGDVGIYAEFPKPVWVLGATAPPSSVYTSDQTEFGLLESQEALTLSGGSGTGAQAGQRAAMLSGTPIVLDSLILDPKAGVTMDDLIPGVMFVLRLDEPCFAVQANLILETVSVSTTPANGETVQLTFQPTGF
jgi:hypothetical protein